MKLYSLLLKSYAAAPDFEEEKYFESKEEAVDHWYSRLKKYDWDRQMISNSVQEINLPNLMEL